MADRPEAGSPFSDLKKVVAPSVVFRRSPPRGQLNSAFSTVKSLELVVPATTALPPGPTAIEFPRLREPSDPPRNVEYTKAEPAGSSFITKGLSTPAGEALVARNAPVVVGKS